jgi:hypothetical protein
MVEYQNAHIVGPATSLSPNGYFFFNIDANDVNWGYNLVTKTRENRYGRETQILGCNIGDVIVNFSSSILKLQGVEELNRIKQYCLAIQDWHTDTEGTIEFHLDAASLHFRGRIKDVSYSDSLTNTQFPVTITFQVQEDYQGAMFTTAYSQFFSTVIKGVGYDVNTMAKYSGPQTEEEAYTGITGGSVG